MTSSVLRFGFCRSLRFHHCMRSISCKAVRIHDHGGVDTLRCETTEISDLKDGQILIKNLFAGLNFIDTYQRSGLYKVPLPSTLGMDGAGIVEQTTYFAETEYGLKVGDRISYYDLGSYAQYKILDGAKAIAIPDNISCELAVASMVQGMTAHYLCMSTFALQQKNTCVIHAAAGGVGQILTQIAKNVLGATVIGTASSVEKRATAIALGADFCVGYEQIAECVKEVTNGTGVDVVYDGVGKSTYQTSMTLLKPRGMCVFFGNASGTIPDINPLTLNANGSIFMTRCGLPHYIAKREELLQRAGDVFYWLTENQVKLKIDKIFSLEQVPEAHEYIQAGKTRGKVLFDCQK